MKTVSLFATNGIRGDAKKLFTNQFCFDIGRTFVRFLKQKQLVAVAMDPRPSSQRLKLALLAGLPQDWPVIDQGIIPTPALNFFTKKKNCVGVMISGSHIDLELNGFKFFVKDAEITKKDEKTIEALYHQEKNKIAFKKPAKPSASQNEALVLYQKMLFDLAEKNFKNFKVVVDPGNGTQTKTIAPVLKKLGAKVITINADLQKAMLCRDTETEGAFQRLSQTVIKKQADLGVGYDADGDRAVFVDQKGQVLSGEVACALVAKNSRQKTLVTPINTSSLVEHLGKKVIRTKVGVLHVVAAMKKHRSLLGFESNGGLVSGEIFYGRDGGVLTIKLLDLMRKSKKSLQELVATLPQYYIFKGKLDCPRQFNSQILKKAKEEYHHFKMEEIDGLKVFFDQETWVLFRPSGNAPEFRVFAEARDKVKAKRLLQKGLRFVKMILKDEKKRA